MPGGWRAKAIRHGWSGDIELLADFPICAIFHVCDFKSCLTEADMKKIIAPVSLIVFALFTVMLAYAAETTLSAKEKRFMHKAAIGGMLEVQLGQLAQQKAEAKDVKDFGSRMVTDHGKANDELKALAAQKDVKLPEKLKGKEKSAVDKLSRLSGS